ncbi:catalase [Noviherbaspirillum soli]|uniref:catalase n=1 Tax=Noviherbaspirillum soli TaxID=1064518 RepID=UPI002B265C5E|nr:catalase [Noviherbaspirillum soli]
MTLPWRTWPCHPGKLSIIEKIPHFDQERIPERVVHAIGARRPAMRSACVPCWNKACRPACVTTRATACRCWPAITATSRRPWCCLILAPIRPCNDQAQAPLAGAAYKANAAMVSMLLER